MAEIISLENVTSIRSYIGKVGGNIDPKIVDDLASHLVVGRQDPSDPETCCRFLTDLAPYPPAVISRNFEAAMDEFAQKLIDRAIAGID
jgi:hypothetical protein